MLAQCGKLRNAVFRCDSLVISLYKFLYEWNALMIESDPFTCFIHCTEYVLASVLAN